MITTFYSLNGDDSTEPIDNACCYKIDHEKHTRYYILMYGGQLYDPRRSDIPGYNTRFRWAHKSVGASAFSMYVRFLKTKHDYLLINAARNV